MSQPLTEYLKNKDIQEQTPLKIVNGIAVYEVLGVPIPKKEFEDWYPMSGKVALWNQIHKGDNPDKTAL